jgi:hypothetical protein
MPSSLSDSQLVITRMMPLSPALEKDGGGGSNPGSDAGGGGVCDIVRGSDAGAGDDVRARALFASAMPAAAFSAACCRILFAAARRFCAIADAITLLALLLVTGTVAGAVADTSTGGGETSVNAGGGTVD